MKLKTPVLAAVFVGALALTACTSSSANQAEQASQVDQASQDTAQTSPGSSVPGMDHSNMPGMNHANMNMDLGPKDELFDLRFIDGMMPHHQGGVIMAQEAIEKSQRPEIKQLAQAIIDAQEKEIAELQTWRKAWYPNQSATPVMYDPNMGHTMPMSQEMRDSLRMMGDLGAADKEFDLRFINAMIPHHQGALDMAAQVQEKGNHPELKEMAQTIITSQQQEIAQLEQWKKQWYGQ
jgi:uncharacterized protein (DUF305 family)